MAGQSARLAGAPDGVLRSIRTALWRSAVGRIPPEERAWIARIETHQRRLPPELAASLDRSGDAASEQKIDVATALQWISLPPILARLLLHLVRELRPRACLELGTGFGISTAYQAAALELNGAGELVSLDVADMTELAGLGLTRLGLDSRVELIPGLLEDTLETVIERSPGFDYALLDADHTEESTVGAFDVILPGIADPGVVVIDDINWNAEMRRAWRTIQSRDPVVGTVSLRRLGIAIVSGDAR
jgi:predicted O-methyltransferase YrrM